MNDSEETTVSVDVAQATVNQEQPVEAQQQAVLPVDKSELKSLLHEVVADIQADKTSHEVAHKLVQDFNIAKNEFFVLCERIEAEIKKLNK